MTRDSVTLSWRPPRHDGGSKIKGYIVQKKKKGDADWSDANISPVPNTLHTVSFVLQGFTHFQLMILFQRKGMQLFSLYCVTVLLRICLQKQVQIIRINTRFILEVPQGKMSKIRFELQRQMLRRLCIKYIGYVLFAKWSMKSCKKFVTSKNNWHILILAKIWWNYLMKKYKNSKSVIQSTINFNMSTIWCYIR